MVIDISAQIRGFVFLKYLIHIIYIFFGVKPPGSQGTQNKLSQMSLRECVFAGVSDFFQNINYL